MAKKEEKTNVMRILEQKNISYVAHTYDPEAGMDGVSATSSRARPHAAMATAAPRAIYGV